MEKYRDIEIIKDEKNNVFKVNLHGKTRIYINIASVKKAIDKYYRNKKKQEPKNKKKAGKQDENWARRYSEN